MLFIDVQEGLFSVARDFNHVEMKQAFLAQAELTKIFDLPTIITSSSADGTRNRALRFSYSPLHLSDQRGTAGANGPIMSELTQILPNATIVQRAGIVNSWDDANFRAAVEATGKKQVILSGITTDVCKSYCRPQDRTYPGHKKLSTNTLGSTYLSIRHDLRSLVTRRGWVRRLCQRRGIRLVDRVRARPRQRPHARRRRASRIHVLHHVGAHALLGRHARRHRAVPFLGPVLPCLCQCRQVVYRCEHSRFVR